LIVYREIKSGTSKLIKPSIHPSDKGFMYPL